MTREELTAAFKAMKMDLEFSQGTRLQDFIFEYGRLIIAFDQRLSALEKAMPRLPSDQDLHDGDRTMTSEQHDAMLGVSGND